MSSARLKNRQASTMTLAAPKRPVAAFTLIELLVVMAIIAILAGILLSVLGRGREMVRATQCMSNQRQIGLGLQVYWDKQGQLPDDDAPDSLKLALGRMLLDPAIFRCPID